jgi:hypothetical protein
VASGAVSIGSETIGVSGLVGVGQGHLRSPVSAYTSKFDFFYLQSHM